MNSVVTDEYTLHEEPDFVVVVHKVSQAAARVPWTNVSYIWGKWYEPVTEFRKKTLKAVPDEQKT